MKAGQIILAVVAAAAFFGSGCGDVNRPVKVTGVVTLDGAPVDDAVVAFQPASEKGRAATGLTDKRGNFRLATQTEDGALPGEYKVVVTKYEETVQKGKGGQKSLLPAAYGAASTTPLTCTVPTNGPVTLELKKQP